MKSINIPNILALINSNTIRSQILTGTVSVFLIQIGFAGLSFIIAAVLARLLGPDGYGAYSNAIAWVTILSVVSLFGFNTLLIRDVAIMKTQSNWPYIKGLLRFSDRLTLSISVILMFILWAVASLIFLDPGKENLRFSVWMAAPLIPLYTIINLRQSAMRGFQHVTRAMLPDMIVRPGLTLFLIFTAYLLFPDLLNLHSVIVFSLIATLIVLLISVIWLRLVLPDAFATTQQNDHIKEWLKAAFPMFVIGGAQILFAQAPIIILGIFSNATNIGYFAVVLRISNLLIFLPLAVGIVMGPMIARLYSQGEKVHLQNIMKRTNRLVFAITFLFGLLFILFGKELLSIFGEEFQFAYKALVLLVIGYLIDSGFGMSIITLMMTGYEKVVARYQVTFAILLVCLCILLIPNKGYESAALAFMMVMIISRGLFAILAKKRTGLNTTIL